MLTVKEATKNVARFARRANRTQWEQGARWYEEANQFCVTLAKHENLPVESVIGCLAALSPQCAWSENLLATLALVRCRRISSSSAIYPANVAKAFSIVHEHANPSDILGGLKVRAFYNNIANPRYSRAVTVDTHAARAAFGKYQLDSKEISFAFRAKGNAVIQQAYKNVARRYKILPSKLQAIVWLRVKADLEKKPLEVQQSLYIK